MYIYSCGYAERVDVPLGLRCTTRAAARRARIALAGVAAPTQAASSGPDQLHVTAKQDPASPSSAVVTVTGTVGRSGGADANSAPTDVYAGVVTVMALLPDRRCRRDPPGYFLYGDAITVTERRFSGELAINDAYLAGRKLRLCGYLTAQRRTASVLRTITVARDSTTVTVAVPDNDSGGDEVELILGGIMAWIFVIGFVAALMRLGSWLLDDTPSASATTLKHAAELARSKPDRAHPAITARLGHGHQCGRQRQLPSAARSCR